MSCKEVWGIIPHRFMSEGWQILVRSLAGLWNTPCWRGASWCGKPTYAVQTKIVPVPPLREIIPAPAQIGKESLDTSMHRGGGRVRCRWARRGRGGAGLGGRAARRAGGRRWGRRWGRRGRGGGRASGQRRRAGATQRELRRRGGGPRRGIGRRRRGRGHVAGGDAGAAGGRAGGTGKGIAGRKERAMQPACEQVAPLGNRGGRRNAPVEMRRSRICGLTGSLPHASRLPQRKGDAHRTQ